MRPLVIALAAALIGGAASAQTCPPPGSKASIAQVRQQHPDWAELDDAQVVSVVQQVHYPDLTKEQIACSLGVTLPPPQAAAPPLSDAERRRFMACQVEATKAPTQYGVQQAMRLCREQFQQ